MKPTYFLLAALFSPFTAITEAAETSTNLPPGVVVTPAIAAQPAATRASDSPPTPTPTNGIVAPSYPLASTLAREITLTDSGCEAVFGRHKAFFDSDIASARPIKLITPDARTLYFRPSFLVL